MYETEVQVQTQTPISLSNSPCKRDTWLRNEVPSPAPEFGLWIPQGSVSSQGGVMLSLPFLGLFPGVYGG